MKTCIRAAAVVLSLISQMAAAEPDDIPLRIEDANGKVLGRAWWFGDKWNAVVQGATQVFAVPLTSADIDMTHLDFDRRGHAYYTTTDCSGQAYLRPWMGVRAAIAIHSDEGYQLLIASGVPQVLVVNSERGAPKKCRTHTTQLGVAPVVETMDITGKYQLPFSVR